ncbi:MAG: hypothetical protein AAFQ62_15940 [Pseudomonadota bacterium]
MFGNVSVGRTTVHNNSTPVPSTVRDRVTVRDVSVFQCRHYACLAHGAIFEDVTVTDIKCVGNAPSFLWGCSYSRVSLRGYIGGLMFRWQCDLQDMRLSTEVAAAQSNEYAGVEWALDLTEADFSSFEALLGVPARLVKRKSGEHFVLTRAAAESIISGSEGYSVWRISAEDLLESPFDDTVLVVGGTGSAKRRDLDEARALQDKGLLL